MSVFLLILGGVTTVAGLALAGSGFSIHDRTFDPEFVTPGTIAAVGGLLLVGMGLAVHELRRIERALAVRRAPRLARPADAAAAVAAQLPDGPGRMPFPPKPKANPQPVAVNANLATAPAEDAVLESVHAKFPALVQVEDAPAVEGDDVSLMPPAPIHVEDVSEAKNVAAVGRGGNGAAPARVVQRVALKARVPGSPGPAKGSAFNALWPSGPRRDTRIAPTPAPGPAMPPPLPLPIPSLRSAETVPAADGHAEAAPVSILKSGVVEGMAYTLYSDGSIEAQLPQGVLRFGSIAALRDHIESAS